ncbi:MAG: bifunctional UDP-4-keto-pentose/UDP-xylose synthase [Desulfobacterales bacterium]|nr:bifunctional UDP-4-keto-pentose/UDP-xylose synthase [Desulfobacterales bacterium]
MKILNLGGGGFIGAHLTQRLLAENQTVVCIDTHPDKIREHLDHHRLTYIERDIRREDFELDRLIQEADLVIDLIAYANPGIYVKMPLEVFRLNFTENLKIAETCSQYGKRLIQFSSCEVYGKTVAKSFPDKLMNSEDPALAIFSEDTSDSILGPVSKHRWIYASAKLLLERVLHAYGLEDRLDYTIIRPFNFIGPKIDYLPEDTDGMPRVFSHFMEALIKGTQIRLVDGGAHRRCYTYIDDAIECIYRIVENHGRVCSRQIFNIGSPDNEVSIRQMAAMMVDLYKTHFYKPGAPLPKTVDVTSEDFYGPGYEDSDRRIPDISKAKTLLGWKPEFQLKDMLIRTMEYYLSDYDGKIQN